MADELEVATLCLYIECSEIDIYQKADLSSFVRRMFINRYLQNGRFIKADELEVATLCLYIELSKTRRSR